MNKCFFFLILFVFSTHLAFSQSIEQIRNSSKYIYGLGESSVYEKADKSALDDLISQISVSVESNFEYFQSDSNFVYQEYAKSVITTYSSATLSNTLRIEEKKNGVYTVVRYLSKRELNEIFNKRQESIFDYIAHDSKVYAARFVKSLILATKKLENMPQIGLSVPELPDHKVREVLYRDYRIV
mgnify:CR=1 FL=1